MNAIENWSTLFKAVSEPIRLRLLNLLQEEGEICVCDLVDVLQVTQSKVSRHLAYLRNSGWVQSRRDGLWIHYSLAKSKDPMNMAILEILGDARKKEKALKEDLKHLKDLRKNKKSAKACS